MNVITARGSFFFNQSPNSVLGDFYVWSMASYSIFMADTTVGNFMKFKYFCLIFLKIRGIWQ